MGALILSNDPNLHLVPGPASSDAGALVKLQEQLWQLFTEILDDIGEKNDRYIVYCNALKSNLEVLLTA